jgi:hypothetical protein
VPNVDLFDRQILIVLMDRKSMEFQQIPERAALSISNCIFVGRENNKVYQVWLFVKL